jgi:hypothetical protein
MTWIIPVALIVVVGVAFGLWARAQQRVVAWGRDTYVRAYPNPGIGVRVGNRRVAISVVGGVEVFSRDPLLGWRRTAALGSRRVHTPKA